MGSTYLNLTNRVLRRINEVELTDSSFAAARGMQAVVKDAVRDAILEINQQKWEWPYLAFQNSQVLEVGETEYSWPAPFKSVDWNSFQIRKDSTFGINNTHLKSIDRNFWYEFMKDRDEDNYPNGIALPVYVFKSHGDGFGISPAPDKLYTLEFRYYINETDMVNSTDMTNIPSAFDNVITQGALYHMNLFKEDVQGTGIAQKNFQDGIRAMYSILVSESAPQEMRSTVTNYGGGPSVNSGAFKI